MIMRKLGADGPAISVLGLGTWALGGGEPGMRWVGGDDQLAVRTILHAVERGVSWIDTALAYGGGHAETLVGRALRVLPEPDRPLVFTKCGLAMPDPDRPPRLDLGARSLRRDCEASLRRLGMDRIDLLQIHWPGDDEAALEGAWQTLAELRSEGKIRLAGASNFSIHQLERSAARAPVAASQSPLSLIERTSVAGFAWCAEHGAGGLVYSPLQSGLLSGRFAPDRLAAGDWRRSSAVEWDHQRNFQPPRLDRNLALAERVADLARAAGRSAAEMSIAWTLAWRGVTGAMAGARRPEHLDGWIAAGELELGADELDALARAVVETRGGRGPTHPPA